MDIYIGKDFKKCIVSNLTPGVCYVCGSPNSATHLLRTKPTSTEPHFPFLEHHEPPVGCELPKSNGAVVVCFVCYSFLHAQWDSHERNNTPHSTRLYWLKRVDQGPYSGSDGQVAEERPTEASPISRTQKVQENASTEVQRDVYHSLKRPRSRSRDMQLDIVGPTHTKMERISPQANISGTCVNENKADRKPEKLDHSGEALDLRSSASVSRERDNERAPSRSSVLSHDSGLSGHLLSDGGSGAVEILDLSMPDKNATTEVCYVCGDEFQKGLLSHIYAKPIQHSPFFPSLMLHPRPSRSRPMDSTGRVQACEICTSYLLQQWHTHQSRSTPHAERHYLLRKRQTPVYDTTTFMCYACSLEYPSSSLRLLYCRPNAENEPYFPYLENVKAPPGASPISPQGMVQVCAICFKAIPQRDKVFNSGESGRRIQPVLPDRRPSPTEIELAAELFCYVCHRISSTSSMKLLCCYPDRRNASPPRIMHFPFLKTLPMPPGPAYFDSNNRTLVCADCFSHFSHQWHIFENDGLALELRHYTLPSAVHRPSLLAPPPRLETRPISPSRTDSALHVSASKISTQSQPVSPGFRPHFMPRNRPVQPTTPNAERRPPSSNRNSPANPSPAPVSVGYDAHQNPAESSIYCFLCGMNSTRSFAHWLNSALSPTDPVAPYFPYILNYSTSSRAEKLREDGAALVCTFCYHMVHSQWKQYEDAPASKTLQPLTRVYNTNDYACYVCGIATYRKRVRALPVKDFPFLKHHRQPRHSLSIENGQFVVVCLDCFESLRTQSLEYERWGLPVEKRQYNWMAIPPPPEDSNNLSTPLERLLAMEQQNRNKEQASGLPSKARPSLRGQTAESSSGEILNTAPTQCSTSSATAMPEKP